MNCLLVETFLIKKFLNCVVFNFKETFLHQKFSVLTEKMFCSSTLYISVKQLQLFQDSIYTELTLCFLYKSYFSHQQLQRQKMTLAGTDW